MKHFLVFCDKYPNGIILKQSGLKLIEGFKTCIEVEQEMIVFLKQLLSE